MHKLQISRVSRQIVIRQDPFNVGDYLVVPGFLPGDVRNVRYTVTRNGRALGSLMSCPGLEDCRTLERQRNAPAIGRKPGSAHFNTVRTKLCKGCKQSRSLRQFPNVAVGKRGSHCLICISAGLGPVRRSPRKGGAA